MPAETDPHERTLMAWPTRTREHTLWNGHLVEARRAWAEVATAIAPFEPVTMVVRPGELDDGGASSAATLLGSRVGVELVELPIDDSWLRDSGPIVVADAASSARTTVAFGFNAWGEKFEPFDDDARIAGALADHFDLPSTRAPFVLEGGSIAVDGTGVLVTTEQCLLHPNRGTLPGGTPRTRAGLEPLLREWLGATTVVWLAAGLTDDADTDGHADNIVAFVAPGRVLVQGCDDTTDPDQAILGEAADRLRAAGLAVTVLPVLPHASCLGEMVEVPYLNLYAGNGFVVVPVTGHPADDDALATIAECYPGREVVPVDGTVIAYGGGGPHCITQQVPACA